MHKIDISKAEKWTKRDQTYPLRPMHMDIRCPHEDCGKPLFGIPLIWKDVTNASCVSICCAGCDQTVSFYMVNPPQRKETTADRKSEIYMHT